MLCDDSTSIDCARVMRGTSSSASAVILRCASAAHVVGAVAGTQQRDERRAASIARDLLGVRRLDLGDDLRAAEGGRGVGDDRGAGGLVRVVAKPGAESRAALDRYFDFQLLDQSGDTVRRERDSLLARSGFRWYADSH